MIVDPTEELTPVEALLRKLDAGDRPGPDRLQVLADRIRELGWPTRWKPDPDPQGDA
jgi:hypothetical protein